MQEMVNPTPHVFIQFHAYLHNQLAICTKLSNYAYIQINMMGKIYVNVLGHKNTLTHWQSFRPKLCRIKVV